MVDSYQSQIDRAYTRFRWQDFLIVFLIIGLAFAYRAIIIWDRAIAPENAGDFDPLPEGSDQRRYYGTIFEYHEGTYPPPRFHFQPGISYFLIGLTGLLGTANLAVLRLALAAIAAVNCGLLYGVTQLAFGQRLISAISGLLLALYPVSAFYDTDLVITSQATVLLTIALFAALWLYRKPEAWPLAALLGSVIGIGAITRLEVGVAATGLAAWVFATRWKKHSLAPLVLTTLAALVFVTPVALHNRQGGADYLITPVGAAEVYRGFNRDATGTYTITRADFTTRYDYFRYLWLDFRLEPFRFFELVLRKLGLFFSATEPGNNLSYSRAGERVSPALQANPLDFRILLLLTVFGMVALWHERKLVLSAFLTACVAMFAMTMAIWIEARIRTPIVAAMIPCAAYGLADIVKNIRRITFWQQRGRVILALVAGFSLSWLAENYLPRPVTIPALPVHAQPLDALYNDELRLVGYRIEEQYSPAGIFAPFRPYVVSLYWMLEQPTTVDYSFALKFVIDGEVIDQFDHPIGCVNYPCLTTSQWVPDRIYVEHVGMIVNRFDVPTEISGYLWLEVYPERDASRILVPVGAGSPPLTLARPAIIWENGGYSSVALKEQEADQEDFHFGDLLILKGWDLPPEGQHSTSVTLTLGWETTDRQIQNSFIIGVYLQNEQGDFVVNFDSPPRNGNLLTTSLPPRYMLEDWRTLDLPAEPGNYRVYVAVYRQDNGDRLPLNGSAETLALIGSIHVE